MTSRHEWGLNVNTENSGDAKVNKEINIGKEEEGRKTQWKEILMRLVLASFATSANALIQMEAVEQNLSKPKITGEVKAFGKNTVKGDAKIELWRILWKHGKKENVENAKREWVREVK